MPFTTDDLRVQALKPLLPPAILMEEIPATESLQRFVAESRQTCEAVIQGKDDRLLVIVGPCSIHDVKAGREYAERLSAVRQRLKGDLEIVMRVYFEKPRSRSGWKGLINDPFIDGSFQINKGLRIARQFLVDVVSLGVPTAVEYLDTISPQFIADCVTWGAIGARTTESQVHRELASGLSTPVGFKNGTDGNIKIAIDAIHASRNPHHFLSVTKQGVAAIVSTRGNKMGHLILRGAGTAPNYDEVSVKAACASLVEAGLPGSLMVDCSHGNSQKDHLKQPLAAAEVARQLAAGSHDIFGVMLESHLVGGNQKESPLEKLVYGQSITDACLSWDDTVPVLEQLAAAVRSRRKP
ncbi:MAG: 3-deoxy-7-phosphoheptulonate synthase [Spirochaetales bacterium]